MDTTQVLLIILIIICYVGFGINFLKDMIRRQYEKDKSEIIFAAKLLLILMWPIEWIGLLIAKPEDI